MIRKTTKKIMLALIIFIITFTLLAFAVKEIWFREDDLGVIINGLIRNWQDLIRVFSADERSFSCPSNYLPSKPNFLSGFARPLKNVFFSILYYFKGLDAQAFYYMHVFIHACNAALFFYILSFFTPLTLAFLGGLMLGLYQDVSWLTWIAATHSSISLFFLLLSALFYYFYWMRQRQNLISSHMLALSSSSYLLSLLARENGIFFPFWLFAGVFLFSISTIKNIWPALKTSLAKTWIFFVINILYAFYKFIIFGTQTLDRTLNNLFLRFPFLSKFFTNPFISSETTNQSKALSIQTITSTTPASPPTPTVSWVETLLATLHAKFQSISKAFFTWSNTFFFIDAQTIFQQILVITLWSLLIVFLYKAYQSSKNLFFFFLIGIGTFIWQGFLAYPSPRYINCMYPIFIALVIIGIAQIIKKKNPAFEKGIVFTILCFSCFSIYRGAQHNMLYLKNSALTSILRKEKYDIFFKYNSFNKQTNFVLLGCPFCPDAQNVFQYFLNDFNVKVVDEPFSTPATKGIFSCHDDYRIKGVKRKIIPIEGGYRIVSLDKDHSAGWMELSGHPLAWIESEKSFRWRKKPHETKKWHPCSTGKFKIHERIRGKYITDASFVFDKKWINQNSVFVTWDTMHGKYTLLDAAHLKNF